MEAMAHASGSFCPNTQCCPQCCSLRRFELPLDSPKITHGKARRLNDSPKQRHGENTASRKYRGTPKIPDTRQESTPIATLAGKCTSLCLRQTDRVEYPS